MRFDDSAADVEPEPQASVVLGHDAFESLEDSALFVRVDPDPPISDRELCRFPATQHRDLDRLAGAELDGVREEVGEHLIDA